MKSLRSARNAHLTIQKTTISSSRPLALPNPFPSRVPRTITRHASTTPDPTTPLLKTPLYNLHLASGAKMAPFAGYSMPIHYQTLSVLASHHFTRTACSLFDVSHMVQHHFRGARACEFLERLVPSALTTLPTHKSGLSVLLNEQGGIVDDTIVTRLGPEAFYVVTNAGCREKDMAYLKGELEGFEGREEVEWEVLEGWGLIALQGPGSEEVLASLLLEKDEFKIRELHFGGSKYARLDLGEGKGSERCLISRGGYTGEDGFEISISPKETVGVTEALLALGPERIQLAGLGARDSLRLEAGMCLYGHDLDESVTPVEAGLSWVIGKERRTDATASFHGAQRILAQLVPKSKGGLGVERRRVGLVVQGAPAREGAEIVGGGESIGKVTSGCPSPTLGKNIAMGYVRDGFHKAGTEVEVVVRGKSRQAMVTKMPFIATKYWKGIVPA